MFQNVELVMGAGCWSHFRRRAFDLTKAARAPLAAEAVRRTERVFEAWHFEVGFAPNRAVPVPVTPGWFNRRWLSQPPLTKSDALTNLWLRQIRSLKTRARACGPRTTRHHRESGWRGKG